nr:unnamed protein product [Callosobruchus analis]
MFRKPVSFKAPRCILRYSTSKPCEVLEENKKKENDKQGEWRPYSPFRHTEGMAEWTLARLDDLLKLGKKRISLAHDVWVGLLCS